MRFYGSRFARPSFLLLAIVVLFAAGRSARAVEQEPGDAITVEEINKQIDFGELGPDNSFVTPVTKDLKHLDEDQRKKLDEWVEKLDAWEPGKAEKAGSVGQQVRNL